MKGSLRIALLITSLASAGLLAAAVSSAAESPPPVEQQIVPEGYFAARLVEALHMGTPETEADAQALLASMGIAPADGWRADYPVTPDVVTELRAAIEKAAESGAVKMGREEAVAALEGVVEAELGVSMDGRPYDQHVQGYDSTYPEPAQPDDYGEGPPVVTYYPPPPAYADLYGWVPSPFWCNGVFFSGFFIQSNFDVFVSHHRHHHDDDRGHDFDHRRHDGDHGRGAWGRFQVTNHAVDPSTRAPVVVDPGRRREFGAAPMVWRGHMGSAPGGAWRTRGAGGQPGGVRFANPGTSGPAVTVRSVPGTQTMGLPPVLGTRPSTFSVAPRSISVARPPAWGPGPQAVFPGRFTSGFRAFGPFPHDPRGGFR